MQGGLELTGGGGMTGSAGMGEGGRWGWHRAVPSGAARWSLVPLGTFRVENQCRFEAVLKIVFELVLGARGTPKTIFSFDLPRFDAFSSRFRVLDLRATRRSFNASSSQCPPSPSANALQMC